MKNLKTINRLTVVFIILFYAFRILPLLPFFPQPPSIVGAVGYNYWYQSLPKYIQIFITTLSFITLIVAVISVILFIYDFLQRIKFKKLDKTVIVYVIFAIPIFLFLYFNFPRFILSLLNLH